MIRITQITATERIAEQIALLEAQCFSDPWSGGEVLDSLRSPVSLCFTAWEEERLVGYLLGTYIAPEGEVCRIAVTPSDRRRGVGLSLLQAATQHAERLFLEVREGNLPAVALYRCAGFVPYGTRPAYYRNPTENAVLMVCRTTQNNKTE